MLMDRVGARLARERGNPLPTALIRRTFEREGSEEFGASASWYSLPSDYCYNSVNRGLYSMTVPVFVKVRPGM
jgi:hypothetical protein